MLLTETEAGEKWCPHVRIARVEPIMVRQPAGDLKASEVGVSHVGGCNTGGQAARVPASCRCIASGCMQWRWGTRRFDGFKFYERAGEQIPVGIIDDDQVAKGYCGLAGVPSVAP